MNTVKLLMAQQLKISLLVGIVLSAIVLAAIPISSVEAVSANDWQAGRIIDDDIFTNPSAMSVVDIQGFLNSKVSVCDTNGTQSYGATTRASYATSRGYPPPFTCLKDYYEVPKLSPGLLYDTWRSNSSSNQSVVNTINSSVVYGDVNGDGTEEPVLVNLSGTSSGNIEFHVWNNSLNSWTTPSPTISNQPTVDPTKNSVVFADVNGDGRQEPVLVGLATTNSGKVEFHVWNDNMTSWRANISSNQPTVDPTKNSVVFADVNGDGRQEPVLVGLATTNSGKVEFHVWEPGIPASNYGGKPIPAGARSSAQLIWDASQANRISPKVLLTTIQKESAGPLTVDDWPFKSQFTYAMGAYCPDSGPGGSANCDPEYAGFSIQISESAALMRYYLDNMDQPWWPYKKLGSNTILYQNSNPSCGSSVVNITTKATAALYTYTPYQPNQAALNNLYGTGDTCSAYGNRNFWRIYNDWFGSSVGKCQSDESPSASIGRLYNPSNFKHFWTAYICEASHLQKAGYQYEGGAFYQTPGSSPYAVVVHRLYNPTTQQHLWVTTQDEINSATLHAGYRYEGVSFYGVKPEVPGHVVVHRLYNPATYEHLWVTTQDEINSATLHAGYRYEGVSFYSAPPPAN